MFHPTHVKLGKRLARRDSRTFHFSKYVKGLVIPPVPAPPVDESYILRIPSWGMMLNDQLGDCVIAAMGHMIQQWTFFSTNGAGMVVPTDGQILQGYMDVGGYRPGDPTTDQGADMLTALKYWRRHGLAGHRIRAFVAVDPTNITEVQQAVWLFGNLFTGIGLPLTAQRPIEVGDGHLPNTSAEYEGKWVVPHNGPVGHGAPWTWGGHCVPIMASSPFIHACVTWGGIMKLTTNFRLAYCDEVYAVLSEEWIAGGGMAPNQFDLVQLEADLAQL